MACPAKRDGQSKPRPGTGRVRIFALGAGFQRQALHNDVLRKLPLIPSPQHLTEMVSQRTNTKSKSGKYAETRMQPCGAVRRIRQVTRAESGHSAPNERLGPDWHLKISQTS